MIMIYDTVCKLISCRYTATTCNVIGVWCIWVMFFMLFLFCQLVQGLKWIYTLESSSSSSSRPQWKIRIFEWTNHQRRHSLTQFKVCTTVVTLTVYCVHQTNNWQFHTITLPFLFFGLYIACSTFSLSLSCPRSFFVLAPVQNLFFLSLSLSRFLALSLSCSRPIQCCSLLSVPG